MQLKAALKNLIFEKIFDFWFSNKGL